MIERVQKIRNYAETYLKKAKFEAQRSQEENDYKSYLQFSQAVADYERVVNFIDLMQEEPKKCMYTKGHYTDEDRKVLCDGCEEECTFNKKEEPVSEGLEKAAEQDVCEVVNTCSATGIPNDHIPSWVQDAMINEFIHGAKWGKNQAKVEIQAQSMALAHGCPKEPVSEDLKEACEQLAENARKHKAATSSPFFSQADYIQGVIDGAKWQKEQMMAKAIDAQCFGFQGAALFSFRLPSDKYLVGSNVKVIVIKED